MPSILQEPRSIEEWIREQENDDSLTTEQFYARLKGAVIELQERLGCAEADGVDLSAIDAE